MVKAWLTSDTHFWHANIITFCKRPFQDVAEMNDVLVANWNAAVGKDDVVFHLGDFGFGLGSRLADIRKQLNGKILLLKGNHDKPSEDYWKEIGIDKFIRQGCLLLEEGKLILSHEPFRCEEGIFNFHGHIHNNFRLDSGRHFNCSVEVTGYSPIPFRPLLTPEMESIIYS